MTEAQLLTLYDVETALEAAVCSALRTKKIDATPARSTAERGTPMIEVYHDPGEATDHMQVHDGGRYYDAWDGTLHIRVTTSRRTTGQGHMRTVARVRLAMQQARDDISSRLEKHAIAFLRESGTSHEVQDEEGQDISTLAFRVVIGVRSDAWA